MLIGLKAKEIDFSRRPAANFVFLLDVSGSMYSDDKLPLVQKSFAMLAENLDGSRCYTVPVQPLTTQETSVLAQTFASCRNQ